MRKKKMLKSASLLLAASLTFAGLGVSSKSLIVAAAADVTESLEEETDVPAGEIVTYPAGITSNFRASKEGVLTSFVGDSIRVETLVIPTKAIYEDPETKELTEVTVTGIGDNVFSGWTSLKKVILPDTITSIGSKAFAYDTALTSMDAYASWECDDTTITLSDTSRLNFRTALDDGILSLPRKLTYISGDAFVSCSTIQKFYISPKNTAYFTTTNDFYATDMEGGNSRSGELLVSKDGKTLVRKAPVHYNGTYVIPEGIVTLGAYACESCRTSGGFLLPTTAIGIGDYAFYNAYLNGIFRFAEPSSLQTIGNYAFAYVDNIYTTLPSTVVSIGQYCFYHIQNFHVNIQNTQITTIPAYAFAEISTLHELTTPVTLTSIEGYAFAGSTNLDTIHFLGETLSKLGTGAFQGCVTLHNINIPSGITTVENDTFSGCTNLATIVLPETVTTIGDNAFKDCRTIETLVIPSSVEYISNTSFDGARTDLIDTSKNAKAAAALGRTVTDTASVNTTATNFAVGSVFVVKKMVYKVTGTNTVTLLRTNNKNIKKLTIGATVKFSDKKFKITAISNNAFAKCKKLKKVTIGKNVKKIGKNAFYGCKKLKTVVVKSTKLTAKKIGKNAFAKTAKKAKLTAPKKKLSSYKKAFKKAGLKL